MSSEVADTVLGSRVVTRAGAIVGLLLFLAAAAGLFYAEHKAINTAKALDEGQGNAVTAAADKVVPANEGKLVHVSGEAVPGLATDPDFGITGKDLRLVREVEVFQWKETKIENKKDKSVTYEYDRVWSKDKPRSSSGFHTSAGHANPADKPFADKTFTADSVKLGAFTLTPAQVGRIDAKQDLHVTDELLAKLPDDLKGRAKAEPDGALFVGAEAGHSSDDPKVGDARVRYKVAPPQAVTVVARQAGDSFAPYTAGSGEPVDLIKPGTLSVAEIFEAAQTSGKLVAWLFRFVCALVLVLGLFLALRPRVFGATGINPTEVSSNIGIAIVAACMVVPLMVFLIGLRWVFHETVFGTGMLAGGLAGFLVVFFVLRKFDKTGAFRGARKWTKEERDYLRKIAINPDDADLLLELAKLLEKKGDPQGEFIRINQEMEELTPADERYEDLDSRWGELLRLHGRAWFQPLKGLRLEPALAGTFFPSLWMHRGIIDTVVIDLAGILPEKADSLFEAVPGLRVLEFHNIRTEMGVGGWKDKEYAPDIPAIVALPQMKQIGALKVSSLRLKLKDLAAIASSPSLKNLTELDISYNRVGPEGAAEVAESPTLKRLRVLEMRSCDIAKEGAAALAASPNLAELVELNLGSNEVSRGGTKALAVSEYLKNLQKLTLDDNKIGAAGAQALADSPHLRQLTALDLSGNDLGAEGGLALAKSANLAGLTELKLNNNRLGGPGLQFLAGSAHLGRLKVFELSNNEIDDAGVIALSGCEGIRKLTELSLSYNVIGDAGAKALAEWVGLARVKKLQLNDNKMTSAGVKDLAASGYLANVTHLDLSNNEVGPSGARALAAAEGLSKIEYLYVRGTKLTDVGERALRDRFGDALYVS